MRALNHPSDADKKPFTFSTSIAAILFIYDHISDYRIRKSITMVTYPNATYNISILRLTCDVKHSHPRSVHSNRSDIFDEYSNFVGLRDFLFGDIQVYVRDLNIMRIHIEECIVVVFLCFHLR